MEVRTTYTVPLENLLALREQIKALAKRARRLGVAAPTITVDGDRYIKKLSRSVQAENGDWYEKEIASFVVDVTVTGEQVKLPGWHLAARIQFVEDQEIFHCAPGETVPAEMRGRGAICDHCHTSRQRNDTFVLRDDQGAYKVVGRNCIADFLGSISPALLAQQAEYLHFLRSMAEGDWESLGGHRAIANVDLERFLTLTACCIREHGFISRTTVRNQGYGVATADIVSGTYHQYKDCAKLEPTEADAATASAARTWAAEQAGESEYETNIRTIAELDAIPANLVGVAASIVRAHQRHLGQIEERKKMAASVYQGKVGERLRDLKLIVTHINYFEGQFGTTRIYRMRDEQGNIFTWFASNRCEMEVGGEPYTVTGTVKEHQEYKGIKQTILSRCKVTA